MAMADVADVTRRLAEVQMEHVRLAAICGYDPVLFRRAQAEVARRIDEVGMTAVDGNRSVYDDIAAGRMR